MCLVLLFPLCLVILVGGERVFAKTSFSTSSSSSSLSKLKPDFHRELEVEWEKVEGAVGYEIKVEQKGFSIWEDFLDKRTDEPSISLRLLPGTYRYKVRTLDKRGVVGVWSDEEMFSLRWPELKPFFEVHPVYQVVSAKKIAEKGFGEFEVRWQGHPQISKYKLTLYDKNGKLILSKETKRERITFNTLYGELYSVHIQAFDLAGNAGLSSPPMMVDKDCLRLGDHKDTGVFKQLGKDPVNVDPQSRFMQLPSNCAVFYGEQSRAPRFEVVDPEFSESIRIVKMSQQATVHMQVLFKGLYDEKFEVVRSKIWREKNDGTATKLAQKVKLDAGPGNYIVRALAYEPKKLPSKVVHAEVSVGDSEAGLTYEALVAKIAAEGAMSGQFTIDGRVSQVDYASSSATTKVNTSFNAQTVGVRLGFLRNLNRSLGLEVNVSKDFFEFKGKEQTVAYTAAFVGLNYLRPISFKHRYKLGLGLRRGETPLFFSSPLLEVEDVFEQLVYTSAVVTAETSFHVFGPVSLKVYMSGWTLISGQSNERIDKLENSGYLVESRFFFGVTPTFQVGLGLGYQRDETKFEEDLGSLSVFEGGVSSAELSQMFINVGATGVF